VLAAKNKTRFHWPGGAEQVARDAEMTKNTTDFFLRSVAWLYAHDAAEVHEETAPGRATIPASMSGAHGASA
jgi:beta-lactamase class D